LFLGRAKVILSPLLHLYPFKMWRGVSKAG
jgi:hypothetical protein